ncbi:hypothetical protein PoB_000477200 [Plakobranchus ocellatus]|uniref:Uncharacterized protein n=1 Tax=Plakobranchus ocellatus TaxID=259542 RepID=A0AAV3Y735_9GAST|nr:hypothetical protein PoB_000477200 [Plakobranchus ocellatus]
MHFCQRDSSELIPTRKKSTSRLSNQFHNSLMRSSSVSKAMPPKWRFKGPTNESQRVPGLNCGQDEEEFPFSRAQVFCDELLL